MAIQAKAIGLFGIAALSATLLAACTQQPAPAPVAPVQQAVPTATSVPRVEAPTPTPAGPAHFTGTLAKANVDALAATIGSRPAGGQGYNAALQFLTRMLSEYGYSVSEQPFSFTDYIVDHSTVNVPGATKPELENIPLSDSIGGVAEAELSDAGLGRPADIKAGMKGKIALIERGANIPFQDKVDAVTSAGAIGALIFNDRPGLFSGRLGKVSTIPVIGISREAGLEIRERLGNGVLGVRIDLSAARITVNTSNLIATKRAAGQGIIIVGSHLDTVPAGPGANDNGSGSAANLELARVMAKSNLGTELRFVWFGAEENGLIGSKQYVEKLPKEEKDRVRAMINLDMVGVGDKLLAGGTASLKQIAQASANTLNVALGDLGGSAGGGSDHASFLDAGIPALFLYRPDDPNYHAPTDKAEFVKAELLETAGLIAEETIHALDSQSRS